MLLPELSILCFSIIFLFISLGEKKANLINAAKSLSVLVFALTLITIIQQGTLFAGAYKIDLFSQLFKIIIACRLLPHHLHA